MSTNDAVAEFRALATLLNGRSLADVACPWCGPDRRKVVNQQRKVLRLWSAPGFITYHCARCSERGYVCADNERRPIDREALQRARTIVAERERIEVERRRNTALSLWRKRQSIIGTIAEKKYLREVRGITCALPATLGYLPPRDGHPPALIACFGIPSEPGVLAIAESAITGVHITKLRPDGSGKADVDPNKIMIGRARGSPIVLAQMNDSLGLAVVEGVEDGLSIFQATGLGVWCAGSANQMPALADAVPDYCDCVSIFADADEVGQRNAAELAERLSARGICAEVVPSAGAAS